MLLLYQANNGLNIFGVKQPSTLRTTGYFKGNPLGGGGSKGCKALWPVIHYPCPSAGMVRIITDKDEPPLIPMNTFATPNDVVVRVYILKGLQLMPLDVDGMFFKNKGKEG